MRQDFYAVLGVSPAASPEEIRQAFRQRARQFHPDASPEDPAAAEHFKVINEAYRVLGTPQLRAAYDRALRIVAPPPSTPTQSQIPTAPSMPAMPGTPGTPGTPGASPFSDVSTAPRARVTMAPELHPGMMSLGAPSLAIRYTPAQSSIVPPRELTRFYLLGELGATREFAVIDPLPLDLALVIDRSSSMAGAKIYEVKRAVRNMLDRLRTDDRLTLVFFDDKAEVLADGEGVQGRAGVESALDNLTTKGGTEIANALTATLERLAARQNRTRVASLLLLTDGRTYGDEERCRELAAYARDIGVSITALGLGTDWHRELLDRLAAISGGSSDFVERPVDLQPVFEDMIMRLRATLAAGMRMTFDPAPGVRIARATRVAPDIAEGFSVPTGVLAAMSAEPQPVTIDLGALVGRPDIESAAVVWEMLLDPVHLKPQSGVFELGRLSASYWAPRHGGAHQEHLELAVQVPMNARGEQSPIAPDVRLALELITAYRLQAQADSLKEAGKGAEAAKRMNTAALRLQAAGSDELAHEAMQASRALSGAPGQGITETLRVKYGTKKLGIFHRLRSRARGAR
jgi:Ca-activated chloride channel homolog